jgi:GNAT superfamily N-acetyltransferase
MILSQSRDPDTRVFASVDGDDVIHAVVCCQRRAGGAVFVWGLRTRPERRGQGLARQLMVRPLAGSLPAS